MEVAFLHAPQNITRKGPPQYYIMPMGSIMLANVLREQGIESRVYHLGIEREHGSTPEEVISRLDAPVFAIDIHWYVHLYDGVKVARLCKSVHPDATVIVGGITASCFPRELLSMFPFIDVVVKGDAEVPVVQLAKTCLDGGSLKDIPNIVYNKGLTENPHQYVAQKEELSRLPYVADPLPVEHATTYFHREMQGESCFPTFWFCCGRGCTFNCCWCGGALTSHMIHSKRYSITIRDPEKVAQEVILLAPRLNSASFSHDIAVLGTKYSSKLFSTIKGESLDIGAYWEVFDPSLYSREMLLTIAKTFNPQRSKFAVSLGSAVPEIREKSGMAHFTNNHFLEMLTTMRALGFQVEGYFHILPPETYESMKTTLMIVEKIQDELKIPFFYWSPTLDPASPMQAHPDAFGLVSRMHTFDDYWQACSKGMFMGYDLPNFTEQDMISLSTGRPVALPEPLKILYEKVTRQRNALIGVADQSTDHDLAAETLFI